MDPYQQLVEHLAQHPGARSCLGCLAAGLGVNRKRLEDAFRRVADERPVHKQYVPCPHCGRVKLVYWTNAPAPGDVPGSLRAQDRELAVGDLVKWRTGAADTVGRVVGFTTREDRRHAIVRWRDDRLAPNPSAELLHRLERVEEAEDG